MPKRTDLVPTAHRGIFKTAGGHVVRSRPVDPRTGRPVDRARFVPGALRAAVKAKRQDESEIEELGAVKRTKFRAYVTSWYARKLPGLAMETASRYRVSLDEHILPTFGGWYVDAITSDELVAWRDARAAATYVPKGEGARSPQTYSARTVNGWVRLIRQVLADAFTELRLGPSPAARLHALPEPAVYTDADPNLLTAEELSTFLAALRETSPNFYPLVLTMAMTGLRVSEAIPLRWTDLDGEVLTIRRSATVGHVRETTKTGLSRRIPLTPDVLRVLAEHRASLEERARKESIDRGEIRAVGPWMFPSSNGKPRRRQTLAKPIARALAAVDRAGAISTHGLRRTMNDLLAKHAARDVQKAITGHSTDRMADHYAHVRIEARAEALGRIAAVVPIGRPKP